MLMVNLAFDLLSYAHKSWAISVEFLDIDCFLSFLNFFKEKRIHYDLYKLYINCISYVMESN